MKNMRDDFPHPPHPNVKINIFFLMTPSLTWIINPTLHGLTAQTGRLILVQSSSKFGHMVTNYGQDPKKF